IANCYQPIEQGNRGPGCPAARIPYCNQPKDPGNRGPNCPPPNILWWYDRSVRRCRRMLYLGCGGNSNRWCRYAVCERRCGRSPNCHQPLSWGYQGPGCQFRLMWWYDGSVNICRQMNYFGCGGNGNRWCSRADCERRCRRATIYITNTTTLPLQLQ
ncbi:hypothetical protein DOY81_011145, partial [Sarcophaga bullata]